MNSLLGTKSVCNTRVNPLPLHPCLCYSTLDYLLLYRGPRKEYLIGKSLLLFVCLSASMRAPSALDMPIQGVTGLPDSLLRGKDLSKACACTVAD